MKIGKTENELHLEKMTICREIVKKIIDFGVTEKQKQQIIYLLSLELENRDVMLSISKTINGENNKSEETKILGLD
tara:strand:+ start:2340 stop:2567 length:228 start_codon:yes stop_codon:yes gene_type:complete